LLSLHTITSQSTGASSFRQSALTLWNAATTAIPSGTSSAACCAAEPCQTPSGWVGLPPTLAARGTVASTTIWPERNEDFRCFKVSAWASKGIVSTTISAAAQAEALSVPDTLLVRAGAPI